MSESTEVLAGQRIVIVLATFDMGGAERQALHLASYLQDQCKADVAVVALFGGTGQQIVRKMCVERRLASLRVSMPEHEGSVPTFRSLRQFAREVRFLRPDWLLPYTALPNVLCGVTWRMAGAKGCIWNQRDSGLELTQDRWTLAALRNASCLVANSRTARDCLVDQFGVAGQRVRLVHNGVELGAGKESREALRRRLGEDLGAFVAVMVANVYSVKDHATLVRAWKLVCERRSDLKPTLWLAGKEIEAGAVRELIRQLGLESQVRFLGAVEDVASLLRAADLAVFSSANEGMPNAVLESMAAGLAVVATDISGCRDALGEGYEYLAPAGDASGFAERVLELAGDAGKRGEVGGRLKERAEREFSVAKMCRMMGRVLARWKGE